MELIDFSALQRATGYTRVGDVTECLHKQGIRFLYGKGGEGMVARQLPELRIVTYTRS